MDQLIGRPAIIYGRFSSHAQKNSFSRERQTQLAYAFVNRYKLELIPEGVWFDAGMSAYKGKHRQQGELGKLLALIQDNRIPKQTVLVVESLDRLSRESPLEAFDLTREIIKAGISIVTLQDQQTYDNEQLQKDPSKIFLLLAGMQRAHSEALARSERSKASWVHKRTMLEKGELPRMRRPYWLDKQGEVIEPNAQAVRDIFRWYTEDINSFQTITRRLNEQGTPSPSGVAWRTSQVARYVKDAKVIGLVGITEVYPPIVSRETFTKAQRILEKKRGAGRVAKSWSSAVRRVVTCGTCGSTLQAHSSGKPVRDSRTLYCRKNMNGACTTKGGINYKLALLFAVWAAIDKIAHTEALRTVREQERHDYSPEIKALSEQSDNLAEAIKLASDIPTLIIKLREVESRRAELIELQKEGLISADADIFDELCDWRYNRLPIETAAALEGRDIPASVELNRRLQESGIKIGWDGQHLTCDQFKARRSKDGKQLFIERHGVIKKTGDGTMELGGGWWYLETPTT